jgi:CHAT domain-containing protein/tetratricopeptide (TPR) repeat protein
MDLHMREHGDADSIFAGLIFGLLLLAALPAAGQAQTASFAPPPRTITDITAILDQQKPDPAQAAKNKADADANPPAGASAGALGQFYFNRCQARAAIGRNNEAIADCEKAVASSGDYVRDTSRYQQFLSGQYRMVGEYKKSIEIEQAMARRFEQMERNKGRFFGINLRLILAYLNIGDLNQAEVYAKKNQALLKESRSWNNADKFRSNWESNIENGNARLFATRGRFREAEAAYHKAQMLLRDALLKSGSWPNPPPKGQMEQSIDFLTSFEGQTKARQGRLAEAEADIRRALLSRLKAVGKYHPDTAQISIVLADILVEQARYAEAEQLARTAVDIYRSLGYPVEAPVHASALNNLAAALFSQGRWNEAAEIYTILDDATKDWEPARRDGIRLGWARIFTNYYTRKVAAGIELALANVARAKERIGTQHFNYAMAQAVLGAGYVFARRDAEALQTFKAAIPVLLASSRDGEDDATSAVSFDRRLSNVMEAYLALLARMLDASGNAAAESFQFGELIRGRSVEKALSASSARLVARDPALASLVRKEQDLEKQIGAELGSLNEMLALPPGERNDKDVASLRAAIDKLRAQRAAAKRDIERKFPNYADLVAPKPSTVENIRLALKPGEAFLSFYFGRRASFVWAVPKQGPVAFAAVDGSATAFEMKISKLREALEPNATSIGDIPPFDLKLAHELYTRLLKPVESGWRPARNLIVVTNGALGLLPLGLLPTAPADLKADAEPYFAGYRDVPWLARTHAVTLVPSAAALRTLRQLPPGSAKREQMIGFGDPLFNKEQAAEALEDDKPVQVAETAMRGLPLKRRAAPQTRGVDSAQIGLLPRLPDTADELKSIALALQADPSKVVNLGKAANEQTVKSTDLSKYRIIVFATHGLVPGDLNGLTQPALALSAPDVTGHPGDGLLTMEEILALKLDADWVVLSACNTGAAAGAGAEAASGLGRAFFYAGTRAILVTNWSVHSQSARELVTDLFRRQSADAKLTRGEALRQAMMAMIDGKGFTDAAGKTVFAYAHPLFWAPYTIIGDGGAQN